MILIETEIIENEQHYRKNNINVKISGDYNTIFNELYYFHEFVLGNTELKYIWDHVVYKRVHSGKGVI